MQNGEILDYLISISKKKNKKKKLDKNRLRPLDADLQVPDTSKFKNTLRETKIYFPKNDE